MVSIYRVLRYVKTKLNYGLVFKRESQCKLFGYCDVNYAGHVNTCRSTISFVFMLESGEKYGVISNNQ